MPRDDIAWKVLRRGSQAVLRRNVDLTVTGIEHLPASGPVILAARHYHHLYDGCALLTIVPRPARILVGLDWLRRRPARTAMGRLCAAAGWPVVVRRDSALPLAAGERAGQLRQAVEDSLAVLGRGDVLLVFPEGYPTIDPGHTPKTADDEVLPFEPGFAQLARIAARRGLAPPVIPVGLSYGQGARWSLAVAFGEPIAVTAAADPRALAARVEREVRRLSGLEPAG